MSRHFAVFTQIILNDQMYALTMARGVRDFTVTSIVFIHNLCRLLLSDFRAPKNSASRMVSVEHGIFHDFSSASGVLVSGRRDGHAVSAARRGADSRTSDTGKLETGRDPHARPRPDGVERTRFARALALAKGLPGRKFPRLAREPKSCPSFSPDGSAWFAGFFFVRHESS